MKPPYGRSSTRLTGLLLLVAALVVAGCGSGNSSDTGSSGPTKKMLPMTVGYQINIVAPFFLAKEKKLFEKNGLEPKFVKFESGSAQVSALVNKNIDVGEFGILPFVSSIAHGASLVGIMVSDDVSKSNSLVVQGDSGVTDITQLRGKKVAVPKGSASYYGLLKALAKNNMSLSDIEYKDLQASVLLSAFQHKDIDAGWIWAPWVQKLESMGGKRILVNQDVDAPSPSMWAANSSWLTDHQEEAARFVKTMSDAAKSIADNVQVGVDPIKKVLGISAEQAKAVVSEDTYLTAEEQIDPANPLSFANPGPAAGIGKEMEAVADFLKQSGTIKTFPPIAQTIDPKPAQAAAKM